MKVRLTKKNRNRLKTGTHTLAQVLRNQGYELYAPGAFREATAADREPYDARQQTGGMGSGCPARIPLPSLVTQYAQGVIDPATNEMVPFTKLELR